jgi:hypothetical protein
MSKGKKRRLRLAALGLILLGLWGMLALLLGASVGKETRYRADLKADLEPGFGETHATRPHPLDKAAGGDLDKDLPPLCLSKDCLGTEEAVDTAYLDRPIDDGADDATSAIGRPRGPEGSPNTPTLNIAQGGPPNPFPNGLFIPGGLPGGNPNPGGSKNPDGENPDPPDNPHTPQNPNDTPPPDFTQPPSFSDHPGPDDPGPNGPDEPGPHGPDGPPNGGPDQPQQIPEPLTLSLFVTGVAGSIWLRRRKTQASK